jgi:hypothetical protein
MLNTTQTMGMPKRHKLLVVKRGSIFTTIGCFALVGLNLPLSAAPCFPNDPDGANPGNLCLTYPPSWSPLPNTFTDQPPFVQGTGQPAYYGYPVSPTQPGTIIGRTDGYWTGVQAVNGKTTITDSNGNAIVAP